MLHCLAPFTLSCRETAGAWAIIHSCCSSTTDLALLSSLAPTCLMVVYVQLESHKVGRLSDGLEQAYLP
jgi:hypothetical protein